MIVASSSALLWPLAPPAKLSAIDPDWSIRTMKAVGDFRLTSAL